MIVSNAGGPCELMVEGETGTVFQAGSKDDLIAAIRRLTASRPQLAEMGKKARTFTLQKAPNADETYSTILHTGKAANMTDEYQPLTAA